MLHDVECSKQLFVSKHLSRFVNKMNCLDRQHWSLHVYINSLIFSSSTHSHTHTHTHTPSYIHTRLVNNGSSSSKTNHHLRPRRLPYRCTLRAAVSLPTVVEKKGYENLCVRLPSMTERAGTKDGGMAQDVASIKALLEVLVWDEEGGDGVWGADPSSPRPSSSSRYPPTKRASGQRSIVLVMHDTGAVSGTQAAVNLTRTHRRKERKKGGIIGMVFIDGILVPEGESLESTMKAVGEPALPRYAQVDVSVSILRLCLAIIEC